MKRLVLTTLIALAGAGTASAQFLPPARPNYGPGYRPQLSPYLNLLRGGDPAANYFLGVIPEEQRRYNARVFSADIADLDRRLLGATAPTEEQRLFTPLPGTGHPTVFGNTGTYFGGSNPYGGPGLRQPTPLPGQRR
jgi:hypothetical protein